MILYLIGWLVLMGAFLFTQQRFYDVHERVHHRWPRRTAPWLLSHQPTFVQLRSMVRTTFQRDGDAGIEKARRTYVIVLALLAAYTFIGLPIAGWLFSSN